MAAIESKRSVPSAQPRKKHSAISAQHSGLTKNKRPQAGAPALQNPKHRNPKRAETKKPKAKKRQRLPASLRYIETRRGKTTTRRYPGRRFYRLEEVRGKVVDFVELFLTAGYHSIDVRFDDKTSLSFVVDPGFTLETEHADWKTGNWRPIKRWPLIHSESHRIER